MRIIPFNVITLEKLKLMKACKEGVKFFKNNFNPDFELKIDQIDGDYDCFVSWLKHCDCNLLFDDRNNFIEIKDRFGYTITYKYDDRGNRIEGRHADDSYDTFKYDDRNNLIEIRCSNGEFYKYKYDIKGNCTKEEHHCNVVVEYKYDDRRNCIEENYSNGNYYTYKYDDRGNILEIGSSDGVIVKYKYDDRNNCIGEKHSNGCIVTYDYKHNTEGNLEEIYENGSLILKITY